MKDKGTILITGASGFVGSHAVKYFLDRGFKVRALDGDIRNLDSVLKATRGVDKAIHLAAAKQDEKDSYEINVGGAKNLVEACIKNNVELIINISTTSTKIAKRGTYGETKKLAEEFLRQSKISTVTLKPSLIYGDLKNAAFGSLAKYSKLPVTPVFGSGKCKFRPIYIADMLKALETALSDEKLRNKTYDAVGPDAVSMDSLIKMIGGKVFRKKVRIMHLPPKMGFLLAYLLSLVFYRSPITKSNILGSTQDVEMDYELFTKDFGFKPIGLKKGLEILKEEVFDEARLILSYAASRSFPKIKITGREEWLYHEAVSRGNIAQNLSPAVFKYPFVLGPLEFLSKFYKNAVLPKKIYIAAVILECSPSSAKWLLPKKRAVFDILLLCSYLTVSFLIKAVSSLFFIPFPNFVKKNVA